jgi:hypothetical protein
MSSAEVEEGVGAVVERGTARATRGPRASRPSPVSPRRSRMKSKRPSVASVAEVSTTSASGRRGLWRGPGRRAAARRGGRRVVPGGDPVDRVRIGSPDRRGAVQAQLGVRALGEGQLHQQILAPLQLVADRVEGQQRGRQPLGDPQQRGRATPPTRRSTAAQSSPARSSSIRRRRCRSRRPSAPCSR